MDHNAYKKLAMAVRKKVMDEINLQTYNNKKPFEMIKRITVRFGESGNSNTWLTLGFARVNSDGEACVGCVGEDIYLFNYLKADVLYRGVNIYSGQYNSFKLSLISTIVFARMYGLFKDIFDIDRTYSNAFFFVTSDKDRSFKETYYKPDATNVNYYIGLHYSNKVDRIKYMFEKTLSKGPYVTIDFIGETK